MKFTERLQVAVHDADIIPNSIGTLSRPDESADTGYVEGVARPATLKAKPGAEMSFPYGYVLAAGRIVSWQ